MGGACSKSCRYNRRRVESARSLGHSQHGFSVSHKGDHSMYHIPSMDLPGLTLFIFRHQTRSGVFMLVWLLTSCTILEPPEELANTAHIPATRGVPTGVSKGALECGLPVVDPRKNSCLSFRFYLVANLLRKVCFSYKDSDFLQRRLQSPVKGKDMACVPTKVTAISLNSSHVPFVTRYFSFYSKILWSEDNRFATLMQR
uniref:Uncharacterized protein n=1 Tax=Mus spicilegus TaxID=10103 RepID=A0A8C6N2J4_MUSSI